MARHIQFQVPQLETKCVVDIQTIAICPLPEHVSFKKGLCFQIYLSLSSFQNKKCKTNTPNQCNPHFNVLSI